MFKNKILLVLIFLLGFSGYSRSQNTDFLFDERDGNVYLIIKFNTLWWMCQNLKYDVGEGSMCYDEDETNCMLKGRWYNWEGAKKACPEGYRLPSDEDWKSLEKYIGMNDTDLENMYNRNSGTVGKFLKTGGGLGFDADFAGIISPKGISNYFTTQAYLWTSTEQNELNAWSRVMEPSKEGVDRKPMIKTYYISVRCVKDAAVEETIEEKDSKQDSLR